MGELVWQSNAYCVDCDAEIPADGLDTCDDCEDERRRLDEADEREWWQEQP